MISEECGYVMSKRSVEFEIDNDLVVVKRTIYGKYIKRVLDVVLSVFALFISRYYY